jgi:glycosyltransferase involved in cell wall biosynthesis
VPSITVVIPTFNCDRYLALAIQSVLGQTYQDFELIVVDDGSTDGTQAVLASYRHKLQAVYQPNQGVAIARNHGIQLAQGEWIAFLDADDAFLPHKLEAQMELARTCPEMGMIHSGWQRVDETGKLLMAVEPWQQIPQLHLESWLRWKPVLPSAMLFRRSWLQQVGGFDPRFPPAEDTELVLRLALKGCQAVWLPRITVNYRQHTASAMYKGLPQARSLAAVIDHFFTQFELPDSIREMEQQIRYNTLVWIAWYLHYTGNRSEMVSYLQQAWNYSSYSPVEMLTHWGDSFTEFSRRWGSNFDADELAIQPEWQRLMQWMMSAIES